MNYQCVLPTGPNGAAGGQRDASVFLRQPLCLRGLDLYLSFLGFCLVHLSPAGSSEETALWRRGGAQGGTVITD